MSPQTLTFLPAENPGRKDQIRLQQDTLTSLTTSLLGKLDLEIKVLLIRLGSPAAVQTALANTPSTVIQPLDTVLYNSLLTLGIRVGEANIRVMGVAGARSWFSERQS